MDFFIKCRIIHKIEKFKCKFSRLSLYMILQEELFMEFNEKVWLRAAIKGISPIIEYKINTGKEIDFKSLVIWEKQTLRRWQEMEKTLKSTRLSLDYGSFSPNWTHWMICWSNRPGR